MTIATKSFIGKGTIYAEEIGGSTGLLPLGNCSTLDLAFNEDKKEQKDFEDAGGAVVNTVSRISSVTASLTVLNMNAQNIALALRGLVNSVAASAVAAETHTAHTDGFILFNKLLDSSQAVTVTGTGGVPSYTQGTDWILKNNGIVIPSTGAIPDAATLEVNYNSLASFEVEGLTASGKEYRMVFDGLNEADSGKPVSVQGHRIKFNPTQALSLISDDFGSLPLTFDLLKDENIIGAGLSKFIKITSPQG